MEKELFIRCIRELSDFVSEYSFKEPENTLGNWRAVKRELLNGEIQCVVYRKCTEINIIYSKYADKQIEMFLKFKKQFEPLFDEALDIYCREHSITYPFDSDINFTLYFDTIREFEIFVFQYLLPLANI